MDIETTGITPPFQSKGSLHCYHFLWIFKNILIDISQKPLIYLIIPLVNPHQQDSGCITGLQTETWGILILPEAENI